jgi:hypothetical protein
MEVDFKVKAFALGQKNLSNLIAIREENIARAYHVQIKSVDEEAKLYGADNSLESTPFET